MAFVPVHVLSGRPPPSLPPSPPEQAESSANSGHSLLPAAELHAIKSAADGWRREMAACFARLDKREARVTQFAEERNAAAAAIASQAAALRGDLDGLSPETEAAALLSAERERLQERQKALDGARAEETALRAANAQLAKTMVESRKRLNAASALMEQAPAELRDWFFAPAARASLACPSLASESAAHRS